MAQTMKPKHPLMHQLNTARHCMMKALDAQSQAKLGVSVVQLSALQVLREQNGCLMKEMANSLMLDKSAVTGLARRMEANGLITKTACSEDSRGVRMEISEQGRHVLAEGCSLLANVNEVVSEGFSEQELDTVSRFLQHVTHTFSPESPAPKAQSADKANP